MNSKHRNDSGASVPRRTALKALGGAALASPMLATGARAQAPVELTFFYPVAVGGAVTKTWDLPMATSAMVS